MPGWGDIFDKNYWDDRNGEYLPRDATAFAYWQATGIDTYAKAPAPAPAPVAAPAPAPFLPRPELATPWHPSQGLTSAQRSFIDSQVAAGKIGYNQRFAIDPNWSVIAVGAQPDGFQGAYTVIENGTDANAWRPGIKAYEFNATTGRLNREFTWDNPDRYTPGEMLAIGVVGAITGGAALAAIGAAAGAGAVAAGETTAAAAGVSASVIPEGVAFTAASAADVAGMVAGTYGIGVPLTATVTTAATSAELFGVAESVIPEGVAFVPATTAEVTAMIDGTYGALTTAAAAGVSESVIPEGVALNPATTAEVDAMVSGASGTVTTAAVSGVSESVIPEGSAFVPESGAAVESMVTGLPATSALPTTAAEAAGVSESVIPEGSPFIPETASSVESMIAGTSGIGVPTGSGLSLPSSPLSTGKSILDSFNSAINSATKTLGTLDALFGGNSGGNSGGGVGGNGGASRPPTGSQQFSSAPRGPSAFGPGNGSGNSQGSWFAQYAPQLTALAVVGLFAYLGTR